jgi:hypothetical protein
MTKSEKTNVIGSYLLVLSGVALMISDLVWKNIVVAVLAILGAGVFYLLFMPDKPKKKDTEPASPEDIDEMLKQYGTDDKPSPEIAKLVKSKSKSELFRYGKVKSDDYVFFDITVCYFQKYQEKRFYRISSELYESEEEYFINDDPEDRAVYLFSLNPDIRAFYDEVETNPKNCTFHPWKAFESLEDYFIMIR